MIKVNKNMISLPTALFPPLVLFAEDARFGGQRVKAMKNIVRTIFFLLMAVLLSAGESFAQDPKKQIGERFGGEEVHYEVGFWIFPAVGKGLAHFYDLGNGKFLITHEGQAQGLAGWLTSYRKEVHRVWMGTMDQGRRFVPLRLEEESIIRIGSAIRPLFTIILPEKFLWN